jgi:uncharacterized protein (DUF427 family)
MTYEHTKFGGFTVMKTLVVVCWVMMSCYLIADSYFYPEDRTYMFPQNVDNAVLKSRKKISSPPWKPQASHYHSSK